MKITVSLIDKLISLRDGNSLPASSLRGEWVDELEHEGVVVSTSRGSRRTLSVPHAEPFCKALSEFDERFSNLDHMRDIMKAVDSSRAAQAYEAGNSKLISVRSCLGFPVNTYEPVDCMLNGKKLIVEPPEGCFMYVTDWKAFSVPSDVVIVGIENMENFRMIRKQRQLFVNAVGKGRILFVSRYPQSSDLASWLQSIPNRYVHFGDYDLAGINIFLSEFYAYIGERASYLIPSDIEMRISNGSKERYVNQYPRFHKLRTGVEALQTLVDLINKYHRCYDQEGYIKTSD